jgi:UDP-2,4-diacetamido-2,4,6-trideoxy-beta-L-altropyranose hydrolase
VRPRVGKILVIDDLADRPHDCDVILDQNFHENMNSRYDQLVPERCIKALGPAFALLRQEFYRARQTLRPRDGALKRILVAFGGSDPSNETAKVLEALGRPGLRELQVDVVIGGANRHKCELFARYEGDARIRFYENTGNVAELMSAADLSVGAGGTMNWERSYLGLPTIVIVIAENQAETSGALHRAGAIVNLGWHANVSSNQIAQAVEKLSGSPSALKDLSRRSMAVMAPDGVAAAEIKILKTIVVS